MQKTSAAHETLSVGIVVRRQPGVTRWADWQWQGVGLLPGAGEAHWKLMRREGTVSEFHAATLPLTLWVADTAAYVEELAAQMPCVYAIMREGDDDEPLEMLLLTASPYEAQDYTDNDGDMVERIPMPPALHRWVEDFVGRHYVPQPFYKRKRRGVEKGPNQLGRGDVRVRGMDFFRAPRRGK